MTTHNLHLCLGTTSSSITTTSPTPISDAPLLTFLQLLISLKPCKNSRCHVNQKLSTTFCTAHFLSHNSFPSPTSKYPSSTHLFPKSNHLPHNKLFGVDISDASYIKHNGRLFNTFPISNKTVDKSANDNLSLPIDFLKHCFTIPTNLFQNPPHQGAPSKWNFHVIPRSEQNN